MPFFVQALSTRNFCVDQSETRENGSEQLILPESFSEPVDLGFLGSGPVSCVCVSYLCALTSALLPSVVGTVDRLGINSDPVIEMFPSLSLVNC